MTLPLLSVTDAVVRYGPFRAVDGASMDIHGGSITGLIGPNGAGKTSLFNAIAGEVPMSGGTVHLLGQDVTGWGPDRIFHAGIARTFQIPRPFARMSVLENLLLAAPDQRGERFWSSLLAPRRVATDDAKLAEKALEILDFVTLDPVADLAAGELSGGQQKLLELARVLMGDPKLVLFDEPAAGVNPALMHVLIDKILALRERGMTFLIIEHNMDLVMQHCDPIIALADGRVVFTGDAEAAMCDPKLLDAYLGDPILG